MCVRVSPPVYLSVYLCVCVCVCVSERVCVYVCVGGCGARGCTCDSPLSQLIHMTQRSHAAVVGTAPLRRVSRCGSARRVPYLGK
jgi:hypothetical protein